MPTDSNCPSCNRALRVPNELLGKNVKCTTCGNTFVAAFAGLFPQPTGPASQPAAPQPQPALLYGVPDVPKIGCRTICTHARWFQPPRGTLFCPDCLCEWEWAVPENNPKGEPCWCMTPGTLKWLSHTMRRRQKPSWLHRFLCPEDGD
jgi:predicted Zn finger-like uncharacterized protein